MLAALHCYQAKLLKHSLNRNLIFLYAVGKNVFFDLIVMGRMVRLQLYLLTVELQKKYGFKKLREFKYTKPKFSVL